MTQLTNPTNEQELDPIINIMDMWDFSPFQDEDTRRERVYKEIQAHTNAEIARTLDRIESELEDLPYVTYKGGYQIPYEEIEALIQAERAKLKEVK